MTRTEVVIDCERSGIGTSMCAALDLGHNRLLAEGFRVSLACRFVPKFTTDNLFSITVRFE
ncbi:MAG: hypothetical protein CMM07_00265 [Rhodopirellula sp.]|nr:hypothetical protein [Rhodopirellula sp.]